MSMDDTFDEDESLLVSPPTRQWFGGFLDEHAADNNSSSCDLGNSSSDDDVIFHRGVGDDDPSNPSFSESSDSFDAQTPVKPKFSYASAMDALDDLVPSAMKARRRATCFRQSKSTSDGEREASAGNEIDNSCVNSPAAKPDNSFLLSESHDVYCSSQLNGDTGKDPASEARHDESIQTYDYSRPPEAISLNISVRNTTPDASSVFPYPCIRRHNMSDDEDLELKYDHPLKASFNVKVDIEGMPTNPGNIDSCISQERREESSDMSTEVGCHKDGAYLDARDIINSINFDVEDVSPASLGESTIHEDSVSEACVDGYCDSADALNQLRTIAVDKMVSSPLDGDKDVGRSMREHTTDTMAEVMNFESACNNQSRSSFNVDDFISCIERRVSQPMATSTLTAYAKPCQSTERECNISLKARPENTTKDLHSKSPSRHMDDHLSRNIVCDAQSHLLESTQSTHALRKDVTYLDLPHTLVGVDETPSSFSCSETLSPIAKCFSPRIVCDVTKDYKLPFFEKLSNPTAELGMIKSSQSDQPPIISDTSCHVVDEGNATLNRIHPTEADLKEQSDESDGLLDSCSPTIFDVLPHDCEPIESCVSRRVRRSFMADDNYDQDGTMPRLALSPSGDQPNGENTGTGNNRQSLCDLTSCRDAFSSNSNDLLQRIRGSEETRKRDVKRRCYSLELKERIMLHGKDLSASMPAVTESLPAVLSRTSKPSTPNKKIEFKPFGAKQIPSTTIKTERSRNSVAAVNVPKFTSKTSVRKMLLPGEDPYKPFKALPLPSTHCIRQHNSSIGTNRKPSNALRPHSEQNKSSVKPSALQGKPPTRILSGQDASMANQISQRNRMTEEDAKNRRQSLFKARPLPSSTLSSDLIGEIIITEVSDKENDRSSRTSSQKRQSFVKPFTPHSTRRAQERAAFESKRAEREKEITQERRKTMKDLIDQTKVEIEELKACIR